MLTGACKNAHRHNTFDGALRGSNRGTDWPTKSQSVRQLMCFIGQTWLRV